MSKHIIFKIIAKYYLLNQLLFSLNRDSVNSFKEDLIFGQTLALVLAISIGIIYYLWDTKWGPNTQKKLLVKSPFIEFKKIGFKEVNNELIGFYNNYQVVMKYNWMGLDGKPSIEINIYFNPKKGDSFISINKLMEIYRSINISSNYYVECVSKEWSFNLFPPKFKIIDGFLKSTTIILSENELNPISIEDSKILIPQFKKNIDLQLNEKT